MNLKLQESVFFAYLIFITFFIAYQLTFEFYYAIIPLIIMAGLFALDGLPRNRPDKWYKWTSYKALLLGVIIFLIAVIVSQESRLRTVYKVLYIFAFLLFYFISTLFYEFKTYIYPEKKTRLSIKIFIILISILGIIYLNIMLLWVSLPLKYVTQNRDLIYQLLVLALIPVLWISLLWPKKLLDRILE